MIFSTVSIEGFGSTSSKIKSGWKLRYEIEPRFFAPGDVIHAVDDAVLGTIKTVDSATQITLTKANVDAIENNDVLYNVSPIQLILGGPRY